MVDALLRAYRLYGYRVQRMLHVAGVLQSAARSRASTHCSVLFIILTCTIMDGFAINFCRYHLGDLQLLTTTLGMASSCMGPVLKALCFLVKREKLIELRDTLEDLVEEELAQGPEARALMLAPLHMFDRLGYTLFAMVGMTLVMLFCPTLLYNIHQFVSQAEPREYRSTYPVKYPWALPQSGFLLSLHVLYEFVVAWIIVFTTGGVDGLFGYHSFQITTVLRAMSFRLTNPSAKRDYSHLLRTCVNKHRQLLRCRAILEEVYGPIILWPILTNALVMCALVYDITSSTEVTLEKIILFVVYLILKLVQTFTYTWYGSVIVSESEMFRQAIYFSEWSDCASEQNVRADVIVPMLQKPMTIMALNACSVSVDMFVNIINTTMSYFFLLQTLDERK